jgi:hypothetical protein
MLTVKFCLFVFQVRTSIPVHVNGSGDADWLTEQLNYLIWKPGADNEKIFTWVEVS